jgi:tetratricopeptide (TPR) repeat protein
LYIGAALAESQSEHAEALRLLKTCLELRRGLGNPYDIAATLSTLSLARLQAGDSDGAEAGEREALQIFRQLGERAAEAIGLLHLGQIAIYRGDDAQANGHLEQCLAVARAIKSQEIEGECELLLGEAAFEAGDLTQAALRFKRSLTVCREGGDKRGEASALWQLGKVELQGGEVASARIRLGEALRSFREFEVWEHLLGCLEDQSMLAHVEARPGVAVRIAVAAELARQRLSLKRSPRGEQRWQRQIETIRRALPDAEFEAAWNEGREWPVDEAIRAALSTREELVAA